MSDRATLEEAAPSEAPTKLPEGPLDDQALDDYLTAQIQAAYDEAEEAEKPAEDKEQPAETEEEPEAEEAEGEETEEDSEAEEADEDQEDSAEEEDAPSLADDDMLVEVKVGDEIQQTSIKDLKRLAGQEAALTQKSQAVAEARKQSEAAFEQTVLAYQKMLELAEADFAPYKDLDWQQLQNDGMSPEQIQAYQQQAKNAWSKVQFLDQEAKGYVEKYKEQQQKELMIRGKECVAALQDPGSPNYRDGFMDRYDSLVKYASDRGVPADVLSTLVEPAAWELIDKAYAFDNAQKAAKPKKVVKTSPKKTLKGQGKKASTKEAGKAANPHKDRFFKSGDDDALLDMLTYSEQQRLDAS